MDGVLTSVAIYLGAADDVMVSSNTFTQQMGEVDDESSSSSAWQQLIHAGGIGQLAILSGDVRTAVALGSAPFLLLDVVKLLFAGLIVRRFGTRTRALV